MQDLSDYRREIDAIDEQLSALFEQRMETVLKVAAYKQAHHMEVLQTGREEEVLQKARARLKDASFTPEIENFFASMMGISRALQKRRMPKREHTASASGVLGFQGVPGAFSEEALVAFFGEKQLRRNYATFEDVLKALEAGEIEYGVLPIENSSTGSINDVYDLLLQYGCYIVGEQSIPIRHHLLGVPGTALSDVREVYSHAQGLAQCSAFLKRQDWRQIPYPNTAVSAKHVRDCGDKSKAAIAGSRAATLYGLEILKPAVQDEQNNATLFVIVGREQKALGEANKVSIVFDLQHKPGSLCGMLSIFAKAGLNLLKLESRPTRNRPWEYMFYVDLQGNLDMPNMREALAQAQEEARSFRLLGVYPKFEQ